MLIVNCEQMGDEWYRLKAGVPSASNFDKIVQVSGKPSKQREKYMYQLAGERITGIREEGYQNQAMIRGIEMEQEATTLYELIRGTISEKVGVVYPGPGKGEKSFLASPDRLIRGNSGEVEGLLEIKCPQIHTHVAYLLNGKLEVEYFQQVQGQMLVTGLGWCDLMSYYPGLKPLIVRVNRDQGFISALAFELKLFCAELGKITEKIK